MAELRSRRHGGDHAEERTSLRRQHERWRTLFVMGEIEESKLETETAPIKKRLAEIEMPNEVLDVEVAVKYLRDAGNLWVESPRHHQRAFVREVFQRRRRG